MMLRIFGYYIYVTRQRMRVRQGRKIENTDRRERQRIWKDFKLPILQRADFRCAACGRRYPLTKEGKTPPGGIQLHHVLPYRIYPELEMDERNIVPLCADCHKRLHDNPFIEVEMMRKKANEIGGDILDRMLKDWRESFE